MPERNLIIVIPGSLPKELNPNWQPTGEGLKYIKAGQITVAKQLGFLYSVDARNRWERMNKQDWVALDKAVIQVTIVLGPRMKPWDSTNARAAFKHLEDGLVQAEIFKDDSPGCLTWAGDIRWERGPRALIIIEVRENYKWKLGSMLRKFLLGDCFPQYTMSIKPLIRLRFMVDGSE